MKNLFSKISVHYDKLLALLALLCLLVSLLYLAVQIGMINTKEKDFNVMLGSIKIAHKKAPSIETIEFEKARAEVRESFVIDYNLWTNRPVLVLEDRVTCVDCKLPIPYHSKVCTFCLEPQPEDPENTVGYDGDGDGIPDSDERALGLDPSNPDDALEDMDGDLYSNLSEYRAGTDLKDKDNYPDLEAELYLDKVWANPFMLRFKSVMKLPDGGLKFGLNLQIGRNRVKTYFAKIGQEVQGFELANYDEKTEMRVDARFGTTPREVDVSELTLTKADKRIVLIKGKDVQHNEYVVSFWFKLEDRKFNCEIEKEFMLKTKKYRLKSIDSGLKSVVIVRLDDGASKAIRKYDDAAEERSE